MENAKINFNKFLENSLNPEQKKAATIPFGVLLVRAGAGSGKTRVITARMANLMLNYNVFADSIIAMTFTNKAAKEMKERIGKYIGNSRELPYVGTFHSYCLRLLKQNNDKITVPNFSILDSDDQEKLISRIINKNNLQKRISPKNALYSISRIKNDATNLKDLQNLNNLDPVLREVFSTYEKEKQLSRCLDFDDLLLETLKLFNKNSEFREDFQKQIRHILVDEYQDTNKVQHELLKYMALDQNKKFAVDSLCVVGDEDQSIYSWRGATVTNILNFKKDFPQTEFITIEQNYRSVEPILNMANELIDNNSNRSNKKLWSGKLAQDRIRLLSCNSGYQEAEAIALCAKTLSTKKSLNSCAVLYRSHFQSRPIEEALLRYNIPYIIIGGIQFYERQEIKDLLAYLKLSVNPFDQVSLMRVINTPARSFGDKFQENFFNTWAVNPFSDFKEISLKIIESGQVTGKQNLALKNFINIFAEINLNTGPSKALDIIIQKTNYFNYLKESFDEQEAESKTGNVKELINAIIFAESNGKTNLKDFLDEVALLQETIKDSKKEKDCIKLMTLHAAKGLEFDTVIISGLEDSLLPSGHSAYQTEKLEEERRLFYVGITRAQERLLITHARQRFTYGTMQEQLRSRFLDEVGKKNIQQEECNYWQANNFVTYFNIWLNSEKLSSQDYKQDKEFTASKQTAKIQEVKKITMPEETGFKASFVEKNKTLTAKKVPNTNIINNSWRKNQVVRHETFGIGIIEKIEEKDEHKTYLTVKFSKETKKIDSKFVVKS